MWVSGTACCQVEDTFFSCLRNAAVKRGEVKYLATKDQVILEEFEVKLEDQIKPATFKRSKGSTILSQLPKEGRPPRETYYDI